jgi:hypothetical protein
MPAASPLPVAPEDWPSCADGFDPSGCRTCSGSGLASCSWPPRESPTPRSPSGSASRGRRSLLGAAGMSAAGWADCPTGPGRDDPEGRSRPPGRDLSVTLNPAPPRLGITHWSTRFLARELGVSRDTIARIWREYGIQPGGPRPSRSPPTPAGGQGPRRRRPGPAPPERAVVLCVDEKSQIQALERAQPVRCVWPGRPEQRTHDSLGHGTTTLLPPWRSPPGASPTSALPATATRSSWPSSSRSPAPTRAGGCT